MQIVGRAAGFGLGFAGSNWRRQRRTAAVAAQGPEPAMSTGRPSGSGRREAADAAAATRPKDGVVIVGAPLSGADR